MASEPKRPNMAIDTPDNSDVSSSGGGSVAGAEEEKSRVNRRRDAAEDDAPGSDSDSSSDGDGVDDSDVDVVGQAPLSPADREIQVEFEARSPQECDYFGLVHLLKQTFRSSSVNLSNLAERIIAQRIVGSVITQTHDDDDDCSDDEEGGGDARSSALQPNNEVFGVGTILRLEHGPADTLGDSIVAYMLGKTARSEKVAALRAFFNDPAKTAGLLISERILNMPPQISVPLYETLLKEIRKAIAKNLPFDFTHYILISRQLVAPNDERNIIFTNAEEEVFISECDIVLDMDASNSGGSEGADGRLFNSINQDEYVEKWKLLVFKAQRLEKITSLVKAAFPIN